jgi:outer membrane protein
MIRRVALYVVLALWLPAAVGAQSRLSLADAIARARARNPAAAISAVAEREAAQRVIQARAGYLPRVDVAESWQRGNQPVFVFSSLLAQQRFTAANFAVEALNHPAAIDNFRSSITLEQSLFDSATRSGAAGAHIEREMAKTARDNMDQHLATSTTAAYGRVLVAAGARRSADAAVETARADRELAGNRRDAGRVTDADVLQMDVHVYRTREQQIRAVSDERIARARLNELIGEPLDEIFVLDPAASLPSIDADLPALEKEAITNRPDVILAGLQERLARAKQAGARAAFLPQVSAQGGWEFNGGAWSDRSSSWFVGVAARINVFRGFADKARLAEAGEQISRRALERQKALTSARLDVHVALANLEAARASEAVGRETLKQAVESRRIIRDRYEAGLADVSSLLRANEAVVQAETQQVAASVAVLTETAALQQALGRR